MKKLTVLNSNNQYELSLEDLLQQKAVLFFFPRANTPGCTTEATDFSNLKTSFEKLGYKVYGCSNDSLKQQEKFITNRELTIDIIVDEDQELSNYFKVIGEKNMYGKTYIGIIRSTFIINDEIKEFRNIKVKNHAQTILEEIEQK